MTPPPMDRALFIVACLILLAGYILLRLVVAILWAMVVLIALLFWALMISMLRVVGVVGSWAPLSKLAGMLWYLLGKVWHGQTRELIGGQGGEGVARA